MSKFREIFLFLGAGLSISFLIFINQMGFAGLLLTVLLCTMYLRALFGAKETVYEYLGIIFCFAPFLSFLRQNVISYNGLSYILIASILLCLIKDLGAVRRVLLNRRYLAVISFYLIFVLYGLILGFPLMKFMKFIETSLAFIVFLIYMSKLDFFKKQNVIFIFNSIFLVASLSSNVATRFVFEDASQNQVVADPSLLGIGLVFSILLLIQDKGKWVSFFSSEKLNFIKFGIIILMLVLLVVTTSRIGILTLTGTLIYWFIRDRFKIVSLIRAISAVFAVWLLISISTFNTIAQTWFVKTFNNENGIAGATTGRANQWEMATEYLKTSDGFTILLGYGPGNGPSFSEKYSTLIDSLDSMYGRAFELHSFYLNVLIEFGFIAFLFFFTYIISRYSELNRLQKKTDNKLPLSVFIAFLIYIFSVSGLGLIPAFFMALFNKNFLKNSEL